MRKIAILLIICGVSTTGVTATANSSDQKVTASTAVTQTTEKPLKLSDAQLEQMYVLRNKYDDSGALKKIELFKLHRQMRHDLDAANPDRANLLSLQSRINALEAEEANDRLNMRLEMRNILTDEQRQAIHNHRPPHFLVGMGIGMPGMPPHFSPAFPPQGGAPGFSRNGMFPPPPGAFGPPERGMLPPPPGCGPEGDIP